MARGRPSIDHTTSADKPRQFTRTFTNEDKTIDIWKYDYDKFPNGPIECITEYPKGWKSPLEIQADKNKKLPKSQQTFINPVNGREVGYQRALQLGIIKK